MKRSEFIMRLAVENKLAVVSDNHNVSVEFQPEDCDLEASTDNSLSNSENFPDEELNSANASSSTLEEHFASMHSGVTNQQHDRSPIIPIAPSIAYDSNTGPNMCTFSNASSECFSILTDTEKDTDGDSESLLQIIKELNFNAKSNERTEAPEHSISPFKSEQNNKNSLHVLPTIDSVEISGMGIEESVSSVCSDLKSVRMNSIIHSNDEILAVENACDSEEVLPDDCDNFEDFESYGSEYAPSESSSSSLGSESLQEFDKARAKKRYFGRKNEENMLQISANNTETATPSSETSNHHFNPEENKQNESNPSDIGKPEMTHFGGGLQFPLSEGSQRYTKKPSARERPTICPLCYEDVVTHFPRHLFRHHKDNEQVKQIQKLKPGSQERLSMVSALRKQGYFHLNVEKNILNPTRTSKKPDADYFVCTYCLGHYTKQLLYKHVKRCKQKPENLAELGRKCLSASQTFLASATSKNSAFLNTARIKNEVFAIMRADDITMIAKSDPLICLYGEFLIVKHKRQQIAVVVSNKMREMARMLKEILATDNDVRGFFDLLKPEMFEKLIYAAKTISGYNASEKTFKAPSLALHMGTNLKQICDVALKIVLENRNIPHVHYDDKTKKKAEIKDLKKLIVGHWCNELSSLALKTLQEKHWHKPTQLPIANDILIFQTYLNELAEGAYEKLTEEIDIRKNYKILAECVLTMTVMFNRKRVGEVQYLTIDTYKNGGVNVDQQAFSESLTAVEKVISKQFKRIVTGGKGSKPVPILFPKTIQKYISRLIEIRETTELVPRTNPYLFSNPGSGDKWMAGANIIRRLANSSGAQDPALLTSTRFRKHIATTLQLLTMQPDEMEQIATFMGHTQKTHAEFYRLPQDIYQTAKVAKILLLLEKGRAKEFKGKSLNDIQLEKDVFYASDSELEEDGDEENQVRDVVASTSVEEMVPHGDDIEMTNNVFGIESDNLESEGSNVIENNKEKENGDTGGKEKCKVKTYKGNSDKVGKKAIELKKKTSGCYSSIK